MSYKISIVRSALKSLRKIENRTQRRIEKKIDTLTSNPIPEDSKKLKGKRDLYRIRVGDYRIVYTIENKKLIVLIIKIGHRKEIYR